MLAINLSLVRPSSLPGASVPRSEGVGGVRAELSVEDEALEEREDEEAGEVAMVVGSEGAVSQWSRACSRK